MESLAREVRLAVRSLLRDRGFAVIAIATLAIGIGMNTAVFSVTNAVLFKGRPLVTRSDRIVYIQSPKFASYPDFEDWRQSRSFAGMAAVTGLDGRIVSDDRGHRERHSVALVSAKAIGLLGVKPVVGRRFIAADEAPGTTAVVLVAHSLWQRWYGRDPAIVGTLLRVNDVPATIVGVMPPAFTFPDQQELWMPLVPTPRFQRREARNLWFAFGRLADGVTVASARTEMDIIGRRLARMYPPSNEGVIPAVRTTPDHVVGPDARVLYASLWGAVSFVVLIACANLANLSLARTVSRSREVAVRLALGGSRWGIVRQLLTESVVLSVTGGVLGWWLAREAVHAYARFAIPAWKLSWFDFSVDYRVLTYLAALSLGTGLLFGLAPALRLVNSDILAALKEGGRAVSVGTSHARSSFFLVTAQVALAVVLLAGAGVMTRSFWKVYAADLGVHTHDVVTMGVFLDETKYASGVSAVAFFDALVARLKVVPGIESVSIAWSLPTEGTAHIPYEVSSAPSVPGRPRPMGSVLVIGPDYFSTLSAIVVTGREFTDADSCTGPRVVVVNERFAAAVWPGVSAIGQRLRLFEGDSPGGWLTVVGVVSDIIQNDSTRQTIGPLIYLPHQQRPERSMWVLARTGVPLARVRRALRHVLLALALSPPDFEPETLKTRLRGGYQNRGVNGLLIVICAAIAFLLASVGQYAAVADAVAQRSHELGIRSALGATGAQISALVFRRGLAPFVSGLSIGLIAATTLNRLLMPELVAVSPVDPVSLFVTSVLLIVSTALGCWSSARRAIRVDAVAELMR